MNGFLVYTAHVVDANNNIHRVIVDAGNGKVLSTIQLPFAHALMDGMYAHSQGFFSGYSGLNNNVGPSM